jgi:hypothetical protein
MTSEQAEANALEFLDGLLCKDRVRQAIDVIAGRVERRLKQEPMEVMAWEPVPLTTYGVQRPDSIHSSWVFVLRANTATGAERHPNSRQRMMSYRGSGDLQTKSSLIDEWSSHRLVSDPDGPFERRWMSIPTNVWHQAVVGDSNWVVVSFHTASEDELIEERPETDDTTATHQRRYLDKDEK